MPSQRSLNRQQRDERIREAALDGHSAAWIAATFGVDSSTVYGVCAALNAHDFRGFGNRGDDGEPAEWERHIARGIDKALTPSDSWIDALTDAEPKSVEPCVYFIQQVGSTWVKIGVSRPLQLTMRLAQLQIGNPSLLAIRRAVVGDANVEAVLTVAFEHRHVRGEWFTADERLAAVARLVGG